MATKLADLLERLREVAREGFKKSLAGREHPLANQVARTKKWSPNPVTSGATS